MSIAVLPVVCKSVSRASGRILLRATERSPYTCMLCRPPLAVTICWSTGRETRRLKFSLISPVWILSPLVSLQTSISISTPQVGAIKVQGC